MWNICIQDGTEHRSCTFGMWAGIQTWHPRGQKGQTILQSTENADTWGLQDIPVYQNHRDVQAIQMLDDTYLHCKTGHVSYKSSLTRNVLGMWTDQKSIRSSKRLCYTIPVLGNVHSCKILGEVRGNKPQLVFWILSNQNEERWRGTIHRSSTTRGWAFAPRNLWRIQGEGMWWQSIWSCNV